MKMLEINTIAQFLDLPTQLRDEVQKAIRAKDRLDNWLRAQNKRIGTDLPKMEPHWEPCRSCKPWGHPGWVWREEHERDNSDIHPSQIGKCLKALWFACSGYAGQLEEFIDSRTQMIFDIGSAWHLVMQHYGAQGAWGDKNLYRAEVPIDPDAVTFDGHPIHPLANQLWIKGHVDAVVDKYLIDNVPGIGPVSIRLVHEYKTINSNGYSKLLRPMPSHKYQATIYAAVLDIPIVVYLYTNKDDCKTADFPVPFDHTIWNEVAAKISQVQGYVNSEQVPPWEITSAVKNQAECMECGYRKSCQPPLKQIGRSG
jgi:CRISPR/Cas system-associated exonuclease Cas4 (RecB family)